MTSQLSHVMTLANSIIGVSVLAMPFCFKQCGIVLATLMLLLCSVLSRLACHFLMKSAVMSRRRNFELLAFHAFGHMGKFIVELFIIGFLVGTCIAFFVVVGDLGPQIIGKLLSRSPEGIRTSLLVSTSIFIVLPLGLLRNIDSLSSVCTATIVFYLCLVLKVIAESTQHIFAADWYDHVYYWKPSGILQCLPIFSMALFCQTQLFEIYDAIPNASLEKMNDVVRGALNICTLVYLCVGFFGYIAFCTQPFSGNILMSFEATLSSEMIKIGFVFSVAFSFPLVIFPCRASLNSLLFRRVYTHEPAITYMSETRFRCLTIAIVGISLVTGILIPSIEFVLGLVGSTIGVMICLIFPAAFFISISSKNTNERLLAQAILFVGIWIMVLGTYANLYAMEESNTAKTLVTTNKPFNQINNLPLKLIKEERHMIHNKQELFANIKDDIKSLPDIKVPDKTFNDGKDVRQEPPIPVEREILTEKLAVVTQRSIDNIAVSLGPEIKEIVDKMKSLSNIDTHLNDVVKVENDKLENKAALKVEERIEIAEQKGKVNDLQKSDNLINSDAIKKEESELAADREVGNIAAVDKHEELRKTLEKHKLEQLQMMEEQKELLKNIKEQKEELKRININKNERGQQLSVKANSLQNKFEDKNNNDEKDTQIKGAHVLKIAEPIEPVYSANPNQDLEPKIAESAKVKKSPKTVLNEPNVEKHKYEQNNFPVSSQKNEGTNTRAILNSSELLKDPILNTLTKRTLKKLNITNVELEDKKSEAFSNNINDALNKQVKEINVNSQDQYLLPIALKMRNHTKLKNESLSIPNQPDEAVQNIHRDILEDHDRHKREIQSKDVKSVGGQVNENQSDMTEADLTKCSKIQEDPERNKPEGLEKKIAKNELKTDTTPVALIKTNIYLSEQKFTDAISLNSGIDMETKYMNLKQRDLKALKTGANSEI